MAYPRVKVAGLLRCGICRSVRPASKRVGTGAVRFYWNADLYRFVCGDCAPFCGMTGAEGFLRLVSA
jgi:hypothetical protein